MKYNALVLFAIMAVSIAIVGCSTQDVPGGQKASASPALGASVSPSATPLPTANIPESFLHDGIDQSIAELEIVG
ncbi:MAG: hypothetical protein ABH863_04145 [Candidatus Micrarchaeota archaeon]